MLKYFQKKMLNICSQLSAEVIISAFTEKFISIHSCYLFHSLRFQNILSFQCPFTICKFTMMGNQPAWFSIVYLINLLKPHCCKSFQQAHVLPLAQEVECKKDFTSDNHSTKHTLFCSFWMLSWCVLVKLDWCHCNLLIYIPM